MTVLFYEYLFNSGINHNIAKWNTKEIVSLLM